MEHTIQALRKILDKSDYTVALCGSGMTAESGFVGIKKPDRAYDIEKKYGAPPEFMFSDAYYNTRTEHFFRFYKEEILSKIPDPGPSSYALAAMERAGRVHCIVTSNVFEQEQRGGCENVINLHGTIFENRCMRCGDSYEIADLLSAPHTPLCRSCNAVIRPGVSLFGEMVDSRIMTRTTEEVERADVLLLLGSTVKSEVFSHYIRYFSGSCFVVVHEQPDFSDSAADIVINEAPKNVLPRLGY